jgi:SAM-dependent methyltransferase
MDLSRADAYGRSFADVYDSWYGEVTDADGTARFVAARCHNGGVLELGVGSGRLAVPLAAHGADVIGIDGSAAMLGQCPGGPAANGLSLVQADMRALPLRGAFGAILIAFNTFFNLADEAEQGRLLVELADQLAPSGVIIIEALDASALLDGPTDSIGARATTGDDLVVTATQLDLAGQTLTGQHLEISDSSVTLRPWRLRWLTPDQLDGLAAKAGLALVERHENWDEAPFTDQSETHISVYGRAAL